MLIDSGDFLRLPGIMQARLSESADGPSVLNLAWRGYGPEWLRWMEPVTIMHCGKVLFHGRMNAFDRTNDANNMESSATAVNAMWLLDNLPLGAQVAEANAANETAAADFASAGHNALQSWTALAASCVANAPLWVVDEAGTPQEDGTIQLDVSMANFSSGAVYKRDKVMTAWTALLEMKSANPDSLFCFEPTTGNVRVVSIQTAPQVEWNTDSMQLASCASIAPQYESCITGVALVVSWQDASGGSGGSKLFVYPAGVAAGDMGVKLYTAQVESATQASQQGEYMMAQLKRYYDAVNVLQHGGSITAMMEDVPVSPLCQRVNITGTGTHESWHDMAAMVSGVEWDFLAGTVEAQLGAQIDEPDISEMTFPDEESGEGDFSSDFSSDDGDFPDDFSSEEESTEEPQSTTWEFTTTWNPDLIWSEESTTTWDFTTTWDESTTWEDTATWGETTTQEYTTTHADSTTETESGGTTPPQTTTGGDTPPWQSESASWSGSTTTGTATVTSTATATATSTATGTGTATHSGSGSGTSGGSGSGGGSGGSSGDGCDCAEKWDKINKTIAALEARVAALEALHSDDGTSTSDTTSGGTSGGSCGCECAGLLEAIQQAVQAAAAGVSLSATVTQSVMTTNTGNLQVTANAAASGGSGSSSVSFHY